MAPRTRETGLLQNAYHCVLKKEKIGLHELAEMLTSTCQRRMIMDVPCRPRLVKKYSNELSIKYEQDSVTESNLWFSTRLPKEKMTFVDLELKKENGVSMLLDDLLRDVRSEMRILFTGRPGSGKSTITRHLSKTLVKMELFDLVVRLHLGVNHKIDSLVTLLHAANSEEFYESNEMKIISDYIERTEGEGVYFLLDGYDEYVPTEVGSDYVKGLINKAKLKKAVVMATSRPKAVEDIKHFFDPKIEIIGFGDKSVRKFLEQLDISPAQNQTIYQYFDTHPNVRQLCYLPLHLSMLAYIAVYTVDTGTLSIGDTETLLYSHFLSLTLKQYETVKHEKTPKFLKECYRNMSTETVLCILLQRVSKIAFEGIMEQRQTFTSLSFQGLPESINVSAELEGLSLFKVEKVYDKDGDDLEKYSYSHPTFQEFLAAFHLAALTGEDQLSPMDRYWTHEMYKFSLGLMGSVLKYDNEVVIQTFTSCGHRLLAKYQQQELFVMKCAHEIGNGNGPWFITYLKEVGVLTNTDSLYVSASSTIHDCWYIGYTLTQSPLHELALNKYSKLGECITFVTEYLRHNSDLLENVDVTKLTLGEYSTEFWPWFTTREAEISANAFLNLLPVFQKDLTHLQLTFFTFELIESISYLGEILKPFKKLEYLALSVNVSVIEEGYLESLLRDLPNLKHLELGVIHKHA